MRRDRIVFQRRNRRPLPNAQGQAAREWEDIGPECACDLLPSRSGDRDVAGRPADIAGFRATVWYQASLAGLKVGDRAQDLNVPDRYLKVTFVKVRWERDFIEVELEEGAPT